MLLEGFVDLVNGDNGVSGAGGSVGHDEYVAGMGMNEEEKRRREEE